MRSCALNPMDELFACHDEYQLHLPLYYARGLDGAALARALEAVAEVFWPLAAVLVRRDDGLYLEESAAARPCVEEVDVRGQAVRLDDPTWLHGLARPIAQTSGARLTRFVVYHLAQGSLLSVNLAHVLVDGSSAFHFLAAWAAQCREGQLAPELRPRTLARDALIPERGPEPELGGADLARLVFERTGYAYTGDPASAAPRFVAWQTLELGPAEFGAGGGRLSTHDLVSAYLWRWTAERWYQGNPRLRLCGSVDIRRTDPRLRGYFGNAVAASVLELTRDEVLGTELPALAERIRRSKDEVDLGRVLSGLRLLGALREQRGAEALRATTLIEPAGGLLVDDMTRVPTRMVDFGSGPPILANPSAAIARIALVFVGRAPDQCRVQIAGPAR